MQQFDEFAREQAILLDLESVGRVMVNELTERFGVSAVTVRKDLDALERRSLLRRIRGGAVSAGNSDEGAWGMRLRHSQAAKQAIAKSVAPLVADSDVIALDSSTTSYYLAQELLDRRHLVVITNGLRTATLLMEESSSMVVLPGGVLRRSSESMVGPLGDLLTGRGPIGKGFFGLVSLSPELGLLEASVEEAQTKTFLAAACEQVFGLFDASKAARFGLHPFAGPADITGLYTDDGIPDHVVAAWANAGVAVHVSPANNAATTAATTAANSAAVHRLMNGSA